MYSNITIATVINNLCCTFDFWHPLKCTLGKTCFRLHYFTLESCLFDHTHQGVVDSESPTQIRCHHWISHLWCECRYQIRSFSIDRLSQLFHDGDNTYCSRSAGGGAKFLRGSCSRADLFTCRIGNPIVDFRKSCFFKMRPVLAYVASM